MASPDEEEELYRRACAFVRATRSASISRLQRELQLGFNRASRMIERMEREGIIGCSSIMSWGRNNLPPEPPGLIIDP